MVGFEEIATGKDHVALVFGDISGTKPVFYPVFILNVLTGGCTI
ncbi:GTP cyclohydrolase II [Proteus mirabilis]|uniref:GTP cyclohydrolase II n=1 Tax=Proteus mirabilis TaxID=584 RepID=A0A2X2BRV2_PROMI|nr:GTP cyclohydrolase II [Proteus mirabilis]